MWGRAGVEGLHGQALLYATLRKPLWMLGPHFKWLFILALITRSNPTADTVGCVCKRLECNAEVPLRKPVSLTKHYFFACFFWVQRHLSKVLLPVPQWMHDPDLCRLFYLTFLSNLITIMYIRALFCCCWLLQGVIIRLMQNATMADTAVWEATGVCSGKKCRLTN